MRPLLILTLGLVLATAACGPSPAAGTQPLAQTTPTVHLANTITSADGSLTVQHPAGWNTRSDLGNAITLSNDAALLDLSRETSAVRSGQIMMIVSLLPFTAQDVGGLREAVTTAASEAAGANSSVGDVAERALNGKPAALVSVDITEPNAPMTLYAVVIDEGDSVVYMLAFMAQGELETWRGVVETVAASASTRPAPPAAATAAG